MTQQTPVAAIVPAPPVVQGVSGLNTPAMWIYALVPIVNIVALVVLTAVAAVLVENGDDGLYAVGAVLDSQAVAFAVTVLLLGARVLIAREDHRALVRLGVAQPMAWGWGVLPVVYTIGRGVVLHRRVGRGTLLTWIGLGVIVLAQIVDRSGIYEQVARLILG